MILRNSPHRIPSRPGCSLLVLLATFLAGSASLVAGPEIVIETPAGIFPDGTAGVGGSVVAVGDNSGGQTDVPAEGLSDVTAIAAGVQHTVALTTGGRVLGWGRNNEGQTSVPAAALSGVVAIAAGPYHNVALKNDGSVLAWGWNFRGETNVPPEALSGVVGIAGGFSHTLALKEDGSVVAWGDNTEGQTNVPVGLTGVQSVVSGASHTVVLKSDGSVSAWGRNSEGQTSVSVAARSDVMAIAAGYYHTLALKSDGSVVAWGWNHSGQTDVPVDARSGVVAIAGGGSHSAALKSDGSVIVWGQAIFNPAISSGALTGVAAIAAGKNHLVTLHGPLATARVPLVPFGEKTICTASAAKTFTITNTGTEPLEIGSVSIAGANAADFTVATGSMLSSVPASTGKTTFTVTFTPSATGPRAAQLLVQSNDADEGTVAIALSGTGIYPRKDVTTFTTGRTAIVIDVLGGGNPVLPVITIVAPPQHGQVAVVNGKIRFFPHTALPLAGDTSTYQTDDGSGGIVTGTVRIENFIGVAGQYDGLIDADPSGTFAERHRRSGYLRVSLLNTGAFSATLTFGGTTLNPAGSTGASRNVFVGRLDSTGRFAETIRRRGLPPIALKLHFESETRTLTGTAALREQTGFTSTMTLKPRVVAGRFFAIHDMDIAPDGTTGTPEDMGFARVKVLSSGNVTVVGTLSDGTPFSSGAFLHAAGFFPLYTALYGGSAPQRGSLRGVVAMDSPSGSLSPNTLEWFKPARPRDPLFPRGFQFRTLDPDSPARRLTRGSPVLQLKAPPFP